MEAFIAIIITLIFIVFILARQNTAEVERSPLDILGAVSQDDAFRNCVLGRDVACINGTLEGIMPNRYEYLYNLSADPRTVLQGLPAQRVFVESYLFAGNDSDYDPVVMRLFYWQR